MSTMIIIGIELDRKNGRFASRADLEQGIKDLLEDQMVDAGESEYEISSVCEYDPECVHLGLKLVSDRAKPGGMGRRAKR